MAAARAVGGDRIRSAFSGNTSAATLTPDRDPETLVRYHRHSVTRDFFGTIGMPLVRPGTAATLRLVASIASALPARRAVRVDPHAALRAD